MAHQSLPPPVQYLPCFVAVGSLLQFYIVPKGDPVPRPLAVSRVFDLRDLGDRCVPVQYSPYFMFCASYGRYFPAVVY
jgi:hypothetical protein